MGYSYNWLIHLPNQIQLNRKQQQQQQQQQIDRLALGFFFGGGETKAVKNQKYQC